MRKCPDCGASFKGQPTACPFDGATLVEDEQLPTIIGDWQVQSQVAESSHATVFRAHRAGGAEVALKIYRPSVTSVHPEREIDAHRIDHPNLAKLLDHGATKDGSIYLATEWLHGETLRQRLCCPLALDEALAIARQLLVGLTALHEKRLIHRDLKPENVMLLGTRPRGKALAGEQSRSRPRGKAFGGEQSRSRPRGKALAGEQSRSRPRGKALAGEQLRAVLLDLGHALVLDQKRMTESGMVWGSAARAGRGTSARRAKRSLLLWRGALRADHRRAAVPREIGKRLDAHALV
jgi:serine/threonine protein kinase